jgi:hypothetical protein
MDTVVHQTFAENCALLRADGDHVGLLADMVDFLRNQETDRGPVNIVGIDMDLSAGGGSVAASVTIEIIE